MKIAAALDLAREKTSSGNNKGALKILIQLYKAIPNNVELLLEIAQVLFRDQQKKKALQAITRAISISPNRAELYLLRSRMVENDLDRQVKDLRQAKHLEPNNVETSKILADAYLEKGLIKSAYNEYQAIVDTYPEKEQEVVELRARKFEEKAIIRFDKTGVPGKSVEDPGDVIKETEFIGYLKPCLDIAIDDYSMLIEHALGSWRVYLKRGDAYKKLGRYKEALADFDIALSKIDGEYEPAFRELIQESREACVDEVVRDSIEKAGGGFRKASRGANERVAEKSISGENPRALPNMRDPYLVSVEDDTNVLNLAKMFFELGFEKEPEIQMTMAEAYSSAATRWCNKVADFFGGESFTCIGDFTPAHLNNRYAKPVLMRIFLENSGVTIASAYKLYPLHAEGARGLIRALLFQSQTSSIVECKTELNNGDFIITNNTGDRNFLAYGPMINRLCLPSNTKLSKVLFSHRQALKKYNEKWPDISIKNIETLDDIKNSAYRLREIKTAYRNSINYLTEEELQRLLKGRYEEYAERVKLCLARMIESAT